MSANGSANGHRVDPASLPLFSAPAPVATRPGRARGTFSMTPSAPATSPPRAGAASSPRPAVVPHSGDSPPPWVLAGASRDAATAGVPAGREQVDWALVAVLRQEASNRLSAQLGEDRAGLSREEQRAIGRRIIGTLLEEESAERLTVGRPAWSLAAQARMAKALDDALFGLGRLQPLVDDDRVENIVITGCDRVFLELTDGRLEAAEPVAESDQELIDFLVFLASRSEANARPFSEAQPSLHLRLDGGARLAAVAWVTPRPGVVIRRHRLQRVSLDDLVGLGALTSVAASFLAAAVRSRRNIVVAGSQGAGKTTLVRALCAEIPSHEILGTFETEHELFLHEMPDRHPIVFAWEARAGSGEYGPGGRRAGEYSLSEELTDSFRHDLSRQIVGEVRGPEILAMLKAMESAPGSISTTHAPSAEGAIHKLVTCAMEAGPSITADFALRRIAQSIDIIVHIHLETLPGPDGSARRDRWVSEIITVAPGEREVGYAVQSVFRAPDGERVAQPGVLPDDYRSLSRWGFDLGAFLAQSGGGSR